MVNPVRNQIPLSVMPRVTPGTFLSDCCFLRAVLRTSLLRPVRVYLFSRHILNTTLTYSSTVVTSGNHGQTATMVKDCGIDKLASNRHSLNLSRSSFLTTCSCGNAMTLPIIPVGTGKERGSGRCTRKRGYKQNEMTFTSATTLATISRPEILSGKFSCSWGTFSDARQFDPVETGENRLPPPGLAEIGRDADRALGRGPGRGDLRRGRQGAGLRPLVLLHPDLVRGLAGHAGREHPRRPRSFAFPGSCGSSASWSRTPGCWSCWPVRSSRSTTGSMPRSPWRRGRRATTSPSAT